MHIQDVNIGDIYIRLKLKLIQNQLYPRFITVSGWFEKGSGQKKRGVLLVPLSSKVSKHPVKTKVVP
jgi:hypothetical protein